MESCTSFLSIHQGFGTNQDERLHKALQTDFFLLEERKEVDFILFVQRLAQYVQFYGEKNTIEGNWSHFFSKESTSILISISTWNIQVLQTAYEVNKTEVLLQASIADQKDKLHLYFHKIHQHFEALVKKINILNDDLGIKENLLASAYLINNKFTLVNTSISNATDIAALMKSPPFSKHVQQLFGLLTSWKELTTTAIENQLHNYAKHSPHYTLFLSFLQLLKLAHEKLNEYTKRHLNFYYKDILHVKNQTATPDYVHLVLEAYPTSSAVLIPKHSIFPAGENTNGQKKFYASTADHTFNNITLASFLSLHFKNKLYYKASLLELNAQNEGFNVFTSQSELFREGFMIASPNLYLQSGERTIRLRINGKRYPADQFHFYITGEEKTIEIIGFNDDDPENDIVLSIPATEKKIVPYKAQLHPECRLNTIFPVLKIVPKTTSILKTIEKIDITIQVNGFKSFVLDSDFGTVDTEKAFYPFGEFPKNGNGITISSNEFFMKKNAVANIHLISDKDGLWSFDNKIDTFYLNNGQYVEVAQQESPKKRRGFTLTNLAPLSSYDFENLVESAITSNGKFRLELNHSKYVDEKFMRDFITASAEKPPLPLPYKPRAKSFVFNYRVEERILFTDRNRKLSPTQTFHHLPFGYKKINENIFNFSRNQAQEGEIYLGFKNVNPQDGLSLLIQLEEGTANPLLPPADIKWYYLSRNIWTQFESDALGDDTKSLTQSGLVTLSIPMFNTDQNTKLDTALFWIKITVSHVDAICNFMGVYTQALKAVLTDYENKGTEFLEHTPKETISKIYDGANLIKKIHQPYASFGGRIKEKDGSLYTRISERLRHKNRAITTWDYERIILQAFPEVYRVKTLNHYQYDHRLSNTAAGYVSLIPIARSNQTDIIHWKPLLSINTMIRIKEYLLRIASPHARINVKPPKLETVKVCFKVKFHEKQGMDTRLYVQALIKTLNDYLSPWAQTSADVNFASSIEFSSIIQLLDRQQYVDYITDFRVEQYLLNENNRAVGPAIQNLTKITPQTDFTLFVPHNTHQISII